MASDDTSDFDVMSTPEILEQVFPRPLVFKIAARSLEARPPDDEAGLVLVAAFEAGRAPAWLTAYYIGCVRARSGYETLRRILNDAPGLLAESYAGTAMVRVRGVEARDDLLEAMVRAPHQRGRDGAVYGLAALRDAALASPILRALTDGHVRLGAAAYALAELDGASDELILALRSASERTRAAAVQAVFHRSAMLGGLRHRALALAAREVMDAGTVGLSPRTLSMLRERIDRLVGGR